MYAQNVYRNEVFINIIEGKKSNPFVTQYAYGRKTEYVYNIYVYNKTNIFLFAHGENYVYCFCLLRYIV